MGDIGSRLVTGFSLGCAVVIGIIFRGVLMWAMLAVAIYCTYRTARLYIESRQVRAIMSDTAGLSASKKAIAGLVGSLVESTIGCEFWAMATIGFFALIFFLGMLLI